VYCSSNKRMRLPRKVRQRLSTNFRLHSVCRYRKLKTRKLQRNTIDCTVPAYGVVKQTKRSMRGVRSVGVKSFVTDETVYVVVVFFIRMLRCQFVSCLMHGCTV
uniref:Uncharacterized protein n=1 Tax=Aegilops tauschii subsp. strangulata TaxID=200361 RepID=A0A453FLY4_AEGTS